MAPRAVEHADEQGNMGTAMKRRGLIAGAAALMAGVVATRTAQPVAAVFALQGDFDNTGSGNTNIHSPGSTPAWDTNSSDLVVFSVNNTSTANGVNNIGISVKAANIGITSTVTTPNFNVAIQGNAMAAGGIGVNGTCNAPFGVGIEGISTSFFGVQGITDSGIGVIGKVRAGGIGTSNIGVLGTVGADPGLPSSQPNTVGVYGQNLSTGTNGIGVIGQSDLAGGTGVKGMSTSGFPIIGVATGGPNANAGVLGVGTTGPGVQGQSFAGHGLVGTTAATDGTHAALIGSVQPGGHAVALRGSIPAGATGLAGVFDGDVTINGALRVFGSPKNAAVKHPGDGTYRLLYCMESPESWFEDFGEGTLTGGKAEITLDPDFAALVHLDDYHVFLTAHRPQHLHVAQQSGTGFRVVAMGWATQTGGPKPAEGGGTFSYRVVAKRKDIVGERLAKVSPPPPLPPVKPFTVPETPAAKPPTKQP